jgi:hypothetical protein
MRVIESVWVNDASAETILKCARAGYLYMAYSVGVDSTYLLAKEDIKLSDDDVEDESITEVVIDKNTKVVMDIWEEKQ